MNDLKLAVRQLRRSPGFAAVAVLTLALGIGANTAIYSMVNALFFQRLPVSRPAELVVVMQKTPFLPIPMGWPYADFKDLRERNDAFTDLIAYLPTAVHLGVEGQSAERIWIELVSPNYFSMLGISAPQGRVFRPGEGEAPEADPLFVLTHDFWQRRFGGDTSIVGKTIHLNGKPFTAIGVTPPGFRSTEWAIAIDGFVPATMAASVVPDGEAFLTSRRADAFRLMGRLRPGVDAVQARSAVEVAFRRIADEHPREKENKRPLVIPEGRARPDPALSEVVPLLAVLFGGLVGLVLLIACANVANLMLARGAMRERELAIRHSLGAGRGRLIRQLVTESVVLALLAGVAALAVAHGMGALLSGFGEGGPIPVRSDHRWDWTVPAFTLGIALVAGVLTGLWPAWRATRPDVVGSLKEGSSTLAGPMRHRLGSLLVSSQVAMGLVLLACAGLFLRSLERADNLDLGFRPEHRLLASVDLALQGYSEERTREFRRGLLERVEAMPGVRSAALSTALPMYHQVDFIGVGIEGGVPQAPDGSLPVNFAAVSPGYFRTAGTALARGRAIDATDTAEAPPVAVINEALARRLWPGEDPLGKRLQLGGNGPWAEVVGLTGTGRYFMLAEEPRPYLYLPLSQRHAGQLHLYLDTMVSPATLAPAVRDAIAQIDPHLPVANLLSMQDHLDRSAMAFMPLRMGALLTGAQGLLGLFLGTMGLYAVVAYVVRGRTREIGVRVALGADRGDIFRMVVRDGMRSVAVGAGIGLVLALGAGFGLSRVLFGLASFEPAVLVAVIVLLGLAAFLACWMPARRATRVDPVVALRTE